MKFLERRFLFGIFGILFAAPFVPFDLLQAGDGTVTFYESAFLPTTVTITQGEAVNFVWEEGNHLVTSGASSDPADDPGSLFEFPLNEDHLSFSYTFNDPGAYAYFDALDEGLVGTIIVKIFEVKVSVFDSEFSPTHVTIFAGEQVHWTLDGDLEHSVTNGEDLDDDNLGALFNFKFDFTETEFSYIFEEAGEYAYLCIPHVGLGMTGHVKVQKRFIRGNANGDDFVDLSDAITMLIYLFAGGEASTCMDAYDVNDDGEITISDPMELLAYMFGAETGEPPTGPFPDAGADRTADDFLCE